MNLMGIIFPESCARERPLVTRDDGWIAQRSLCVEGDIRCHVTVSNVHMETRSNIQGKDTRINLKLDG